MTARATRIVGEYVVEHLNTRIVGVVDLEKSRIGEEFFRNYLDRETQEQLIDYYAGHGEIKLSNVLGILKESGFTADNALVEEVERRIRIPDPGQRFR